MPPRPPAVPFWHGVSGYSLDTSITGVNGNEQPQQAFVSGDGTVIVIGARLESSLGQYRQGIVRVYKWEAPADDAPAADEAETEARPRSRSRSLAPERKRGSGLKNEEQRMKVQIMADKAQRKRNLNARKGEGDHHVPDWMPKHLYSGKRGNGKTDWR